MNTPLLPSRRGTRYVSSAYMRNVARHAVNVIVAFREALREYAGCCGGSGGEVKVVARGRR